MKNLIVYQLYNQFGEVKEFKTIEELKTFIKEEVIEL